MSTGTETGEASAPRPASAPAYGPKQLLWPALEILTQSI